MPSETEKILKAYSDSKTVNEATTSSAVGGVGAGAAAGAAAGALLGGVGAIPGAAIGAGLGAVGNVGSGSYNRASVYAQKFLAGRGGGVSQAVGSLLGMVGGKYHDRLKAQHGSQDTANWLFKEIQGLLMRHDGNLTIKQLKDFLKTKPLKEGGPNIDPDQLPSLASLPDQQTLDEEQIKTLFQTVAQELQDVAQTGTGALANVEEIIRALQNLPASERGPFLAALLGRGIMT